MVASSEHQFADRMGLLFEASGAPRSLGLIYGWLLICDPAAQSPSAVCSALHLSKGGVSTALRQLEQAKLVERVHVRGERATYFRVTDRWAELLTAKQKLTSSLREAAAQGLRALSQEPPERRERLERFHHFYEYLEREMHAMIARYRQEDR